MFADLGKSELTKVSPDKTKASPSVYSENDGSFNSEENLRWTTKKIASKPFVVGEDTTKTSSALKASSGPYGFYISEGMFNIDGYLFKVASDPHVSYDDQLNWKSSFVANTIYQQKFIGGLTNYGNEDELKARLPEFCFSNFLPTPYGLISLEDARENWKDALENNKAVGFVRLVYKDDYATALNTDGGYYNFIQDGKVVGRIKEEQSLQVSNPSYTQDDVISDIFSGDTSNCYPVGLKSGGYVYAYYPVYVKLNQAKKPVITFTDVFGIVFENEVARFHTYTYPCTVSNLMDMDADVQNPLGSASGFDKVTFPSNHYNYTALYNGSYGSGTRKTENSDTISGSPYSGISGVQKISVATLLSNLPSTQEITHVENNLSYYCIEFDQSDNTQLNRNGQKIPVALFTSEGSLCTDGLIIDGNSTASQDSTICVVESYIHYIKRNYLNAIGTPATEENIENTALSAMVSGWSDFTTFYNAHIAKPLSAYINLCYDSLLDNVVYNNYKEDDPTIRKTDAEKTKAHGAGLYVSGTPSGDGGIRTDVTIQATCYTIANQTATAVTKEKTISLEKDITSDYYKASTYIRNINTDKAKLLDDYDLYIYGTNTLNDNLTYQPLLFEDPIEFMMNCLGSDAVGLSSFTLTLPDGSHTKTISGSGKSIQLDEYLVPKRVTDSSITAFNLETDFTILRTRDAISSSMASSLSYAYYRNTWFARIPTTISVNKDALSYLRGRDYDELTKYDGITWNYKLPCSVSDDELYLFDLKISSNRANESYDAEQSVRYAAVDSEYLRVRREAFIHISKIYGNDYKGFEECVREITDRIISETLGGYDLADFGYVDEALKDHIDYGPKNQIQIVGNPNMPDDYVENEYFKPNENSNVRFKYYRNRNVFPYRDYIEVSLEPDTGTLANVDTRFELPFYCSGGNLCLTGCPEGGSSYTYYAAVPMTSYQVNTPLVDVGNYDSPVNGLLLSGERKYVIQINQGTDFSNGSLVFEPMLCSYPAYNLTNKRVAYIPTLNSLSDTVSDLQDDVAANEKALINTINRPAKNLLCRCNGTDSGYFIAKCSKPLPRDNYMLSIGKLWCGKNENTFVSTSIALLDSQMQVLRSISGVPVGENIKLAINKNDYYSSSEPICYVRIGTGWNAQHTDSNCDVIVTDMMLCLRSEWNITDTYVESLGNLSDNFVSLCNRFSKNKLYSTMYPSSMIGAVGDTIIMKTEYDMPLDDYVVSIKYLGVPRYEEPNRQYLSIYLVDSRGNESYKYQVSDPNGYVRDVVLYFDKQSLSSQSHLEDVKYLKITSSTGTIDPSVVIVMYAMLCTKTDWIVSPQYVPSTSSISYDAYLAELEDIRGTIGDLINVSSKNMYSGTDVSASSSTHVDIMTSSIQFSTSTAYTLSVKSFISSASNGPYDYVLVYDDTGSEADWIVSNPISLPRHGEDDVVSSTFRPTSNRIKRIRIFADTDHEQTGDISCENIMICLSSFYDITEKYVPYSPTNAELYEMIQNL